MVFYSFFFSNKAIYQSKLCILNVFSLKLILNLIFKLEIKFIDNLYKNFIWKSFYVLSFLINSVPKLLYLKVERLHKDSYYNLLFFFFIPKKTIYIWLFNFTKLIRDNEIVNICFLKDLSIGFDDLRFINFYELKSELFKWKQLISFNVIQKEKTNLLLKVIKYKENV